ncbi:MAG: Uma2 family endonuclease [Bryobacteraceae bacterium]|nr:Uma2 family endonuclease [Bryobacteraceae bacterium]
MAAAPVLPMVSVEEYLRTEYEPRCEYVDGELKPKSMAGDDHSSLQMWLILALARVERELGLVVRPERHIRIGNSRVRIPDIAVFLSVDKTPAAVTPPLLTIEIVSPDETFAELDEKLTDHLAMGTQTAILADPRRRTVMVARQNEMLHKVGAPLQVQIDVPERGSFTLDFDDLFRQLD